MRINWQCLFVLVRRQYTLVACLDAEMCAERMGISREAQDAHAIASADRARRAVAEGLVDWEVVPVEVPSQSGGTVLIKEVGVGGLGGCGGFVIMARTHMRHRAALHAHATAWRCRTRPSPK